MGCLEELWAIPGHNLSAMSGSRSLIVSTSNRISSRSTTLRPIRKKSYLKSQLGIYVGTDHITWVEKLPTIRFAMNTARCGTTDYTAAYFTFGRELRTSDDANRELRAENFLPEIIPNLLALADTMKIAKENQKRQQDDRKAYTDRHRRPNPGFQTDDIVWVNTHTLCRKKQQYTSKLAPRRDGPYVIRRQLGPNSYEVQTRDSELALSWDILYFLFNSVCWQERTSTSSSSADAPAR